VDEPYTAKARVLRLLVSEDFVMLGHVVLTQCHRVMDGQTDISMMANTGLCIARYAGAL